MKRLLSLLLVFSLIVSMALPVLAQDNQDEDEDDQMSSIELVGTIEAVGNGTITVDGFVIDISDVDATSLPELLEGTGVSIQGFLDSGAVIATEVTILQAVTVDEMIINVEKFVSNDNANWFDGDETPGEQFALEDDLYFRIVVTNASETDLTGLTLDDNVYDLTECAVPETLPAGESVECVVGPYAVDIGQQVSFTVASALYNGEVITDNDSAYYFGGVMASVDVEKYVSLDGENWEDADSTPGLVVPEGSDVFFRIEVMNTGTAPLTDITLTDGEIDTSACVIPDILDPGASFDCVIGPLVASADWHNSAVTVNAIAEGQTISDFDRAIYYGGDDIDDLPIVIIIEGPVAAINGNIVTIWDLDIEIANDDPVLVDLEIDDILRIEGDVFEDGNTIVIIAINVVVINIVIINTGGAVGIGIPAGCKVSKNGKIKCSGSKKSKRS